MPQEVSISFYKEPCIGCTMQLRSSCYLPELLRLWSSAWAKLSCTDITPIFLPFFFLGVWVVFLSFKAGMAFDPEATISQESVLLRKKRGVFSAVC